MEVDLALLADAATIDNSGKLNILGVFDRITTGSLPTQHPRLALVLRFVASVQEIGLHTVGISLRAPGGEEVVRIDGEMQLGPGPASMAGSVRVPHVLHLDRLVFPHSGSYAFDVSVDGEHHVSVPLTIHGPAAAEA
jgi:hypothetical protein